MHARADLLQAEQHDSQEASLQEESGQHFVEHQRAKDISGLGRKPRPVEPELVFQNQPRGRAHRHGKGKYFQPVAIDIQVDSLSTQQPQAFKHHEKIGQTDGECCQHDMKTDGDRELGTRSQKRRLDSFHKGHSC
ncbi:hypothetical protein D3C87_1161010 [compost metagenome]